MRTAIGWRHPCKAVSADGYIADRIPALVGHAEAEGGLTRGAIGHIAQILKDEACTLLRARFTARCRCIGKCLRSSRSKGRRYVRIRKIIKEMGSIPSL